MFCEHKNSYLQRVCPANPRVINKAVAEAMRWKRIDPHDALPPAQRLESMQPSLYAPWVDITRTQLGFGRVGLRILNRELSSRDSIIQLQAIHSVLDQVQISEHAMFLLSLNIVYRLIEIIHDRDPIAREKVCMILTHLAHYYQGRQQIMSRPVVIEKLLYLIMRDRKEIRYAAGYTLMTLSQDRCSCETIMKTESIVENLLKLIKDDHAGIIAIHLKTLTNLCTWDPEPALKANAFQIMLTLFKCETVKVVANSMDCMTQLCKHSIGKQLADMYDLTHHLLKYYLYSKHIRIVIAAVGTMMYTTQTTRSKWRAKEYSYDLTKQLMYLCVAHNMPLLQMRVLQTLINLCDCPDIRYHMKKHWEKNVKALRIRRYEEWDGTSEIHLTGLDTGHNYRTTYIENVETIKNDCGDNDEAVNVHSHLSRVRHVKAHLIKAINFKSYKD